MQNAKYAYGVARIRANEPDMLSATDFDMLIEAPDYASALRILSDKGWTSDGTTDFSSMLFEQQEKTRRLLGEALPDFEKLDSLLVANDFHNLKAALKAVFADEEPSKYFVGDAITEPALIEEAVRTKRFDKLPEYMRAAAQEGYDIIVQSRNGQKADIALDKAALGAAVVLAEKSGSAMLTELARLQADCADIKAALRCASVGKSEEFILNTLSGYGLLDKKTLTAAALAGVQELCSYVDSVALYSPLAEALKESSTAFERKCDDLMIKVVEKDRLSAFGVEPIAAYYISKTAELKNVRIILNCKLNAVEANEIRGRVRML